MFGIVVDNQGYKVEFVVLNEDNTPQFYELKYSEQIIEQDWQIANSMNKPQWTGSENGWIDTDPLPPVEEVPPQPSEPDKISILLQKTLSEMKDEFISTNQYITHLELENITINQQVTELELFVLENMATK